MENKIILKGDDNTSLEIEIVEQTTLYNYNYIMGINNDEIYILKEIDTQDDDTIYEFVENEEELKAVINIFEELVEDIKVEI